MYLTTYTTEPWNTPGEVHTPLQEQGFRSHRFIRESKVKLCDKLFSDSPQNFRTTTVLFACLKKNKLKTNNFSCRFLPYFLCSLCLRNYKALVSSFNKSIWTTCRPHVKINETFKALPNLSNCEIPHKITQILFLSRTALKTFKYKCCEQTQHIHRCFCIHTYTNFTIPLC